MAEFGVSRTVVREAISKLQAAGMVETRHGIGTFVVGPGDASAFRIEPQQLATLRDVVAVLELRIGVETEAAGLRRSGARPPTRRRCAPRWPPSPRRWRRARRGGGRLPAAQRDRARHAERALRRPDGHAGRQIIPRAARGFRRDRPAAPAYLRRVNAEHESIVDAIAAMDADAARAAMRTHLANSRERAPPRRRSSVVTLSRFALNRRSS